MLNMATSRQLEACSRNQRIEFRKWPVRYDLSHGARCSWTWTCWYTILHLLWQCRQCVWKFHSSTAAAIIRRWFTWSTFVSRKWFSLLMCLPCAFAVSQWLFDTEPYLLCVKFNMTQSEAQILIKIIAVGNASVCFGIEAYTHWWREIETHKCRRSRRISNGWPRNLHTHTHSTMRREHRTVSARKLLRSLRKFE